MTRPVGPYVTLLILCVSCTPLVTEDTPESTNPRETDAEVGQVDTEAPGESDAVPDCEGPDLCNGVDDDCDGDVDEDAEFSTWYLDDDGDGVGGDAIEACAQPDGTVAEGGDCDDGDDLVFPDALDNTCDGVDNDCDGLTDDAYRSNHSLFTIHDRTIYTIDTGTGVMTPRVQLDEEFPGSISTTALWDGRLAYGHSSEGDGTLIGFDVCTGETQVVGTTYVSSGAMDFTRDSRLVAADRNEDALMQIHRGTGLGSLAVALPDIDINNAGMATDCIDEVFYLVDERGQQLITLDAYTGQVLATIPLLGPRLPVVGAQYDYGTRTLWVANGSTLFRVDTSTGVMTSVANFTIDGAPHTEVNDLALSPPCGTP